MIPLQHSLLHRRATVTHPPPSLVRAPQVLMLPAFHSFPGNQLTLEFWMMSMDRCRPGVPFSYATGGYAQADNAFLLFNYNSW